ncbi:hypothetical protein GCM10007304_03110 [Rhodococcoides trifolii]|uniref:Uncharacterized protein n=1 Tax=Rhodococcoides trifolii TaxID=908250 RepID=A0A917CLH0_9NOCA|nr:hypothetical protein GCM10007304_03110 [Rhodococcus trifolii]
MAAIAILFTSVDASPTISTPSDGAPLVALADPVVVSTPEHPANTAIAAAAAARVRSPLIRLIRGDANGADWNDIGDGPNGDPMQFQFSVPTLRLHHCRVVREKEH